MDKNDKKPVSQAELAFMANFVRADSLLDGNAQSVQQIAMAMALALREIKVIETPLPKVATLVPTFTGQTPVGVFPQSLSMATGEMVGEAKTVANPSDDLPRVDLQVERRAVLIQTIGDSYGLSIVNEQNGWGVKRSEKAYVAKKAIDRKIADIAVWGDKKYGQDGLYTTPYALRETMQIKAGNELSAVSQAINMLSLASQQAYEPTHVIVPQSLYEKLSLTFKGNNETMPLIQSLKAIYPNIEIVANTDQRSMGTDKDGKADAKSGRIIVGAFDVSNFRNQVPRGFTQLPDQARNLELVVNCYALCAGLEVLDKRALMHVDYAVA